MQTTPNLSHMIVPGPPRELLPSRPSNSRRIGPPPRRCRRARAKRRRSCNLSETRTRRVERPLTQRLNRSFALALGKKARSFRYCVPLEYSAFLPDPSLPSTSSVRRTRRRPLERPSPADPLWDSEVDVALERRARHTRLVLRFNTSEGNHSTPHSQRRRSSSLLGPPPKPSVPGRGWPSSVSRSLFRPPRSQAREGSSMTSSVKRQGTPGPLPQAQLPMPNRVWGSIPGSSTGGGTQLT
ncbi:hypothetical protein VUR80DRAFT_9685 [Thermomyces stellatus]